MDPGDYRFGRMWLNVMDVISRPPVDTVRTKPWKIQPVDLTLTHQYPVNDTVCCEIDSNQITFYCRFRTYPASNSSRVFRVPMSTRLIFTIASLITIVLGQECDGDDSLLDNQYGLEANTYSGPAMFSMMKFKASSSMESPQYQASQYALSRADFSPMLPPTMTTLADDRIHEQNDTSGSPGYRGSDSTPTFKLGDPQNFTMTPSGPLPTGSSNASFKLGDPQNFIMTPSGPQPTGSLNSTSDDPKRQELYKHKPQETDSAEALQTKLQNTQKIQKDLIAQGKSESDPLVTEAKQQADECQSKLTKKNQTIPAPDSLTVEVCWYSCNLWQTARY